MPNWDLKFIRSMVFCVQNVTECFAQSVCLNSFVCCDCTMLSNLSWVTWRFYHFYVIRCNLIHFVLFIFLRFWVQDENLKLRWTKLQCHKSFVALVKQTKFQDLIGMLNAIPIIPSFWVRNNARITSTWTLSLINCVHSRANGQIFILLYQI